MGEGLVEVWGKGVLGGQPKQALDEFDLALVVCRRLEEKPTILRLSFFSSVYLVVICLYHPSKRLVSVKLWATTARASFGAGCGKTNLRTLPDHRVLV